MALVRQFRIRPSKVVGGEVSESQLEFDIPAWPTLIL
jgi:hypothetical protein